MDLSLIVPCYNEATHLEASVAALLEVLDQTRYRYEVVFVDDGSEDGTRPLVQALCARHPACRYVFHERNRGRGGAFKTGFSESTGRVTGFIDIDLEVHALYVPALVNLIDRHGYDVATGHRYYLLRQTGALHRHVLSAAYRQVCRWLLGSGVRDTETGCKFFRRDATTAVVLGSAADGWFWDTEVMTRAALMDLRIHEMPVLFLRRRDKQSTVRLWADMWRYLGELHRFRAVVGLSLINKSPLYWTCAGYDAAMRVLYGTAYRQTYAEVARYIPDGSSVVDVCCGTGRLYREGLAQKGCTYLGLDFNGHFVMGARRRGIPARFFDLRHEPIPPADYVVMCSSLYHVRHEADAVLGRMLAAARRGVVISEPVHNLATSGPRVLRALARWLTDPGVGTYGERFDLSAFRTLAERHGAAEFVHRPGRRNAVAVFRTA